MCGENWFCRCRKSYGPLSARRDEPAAGIDDGNSMDGIAFEAKKKALAVDYGHMLCAVCDELADERDPGTVFQRGALVEASLWVHGIYEPSDKYGGFLLYL